MTDFLLAVAEILTGFGIALFLFVLFALTASAIVALL